jgi:hypothetical protein
LLEKDCLSAMPVSESVAEVDEPGRFSVEPDFVDSVSINVAYEGSIFGIAEEEREVSRAERRCWIPGPPILSTSPARACWKCSH